MTSRARRQPTPRADVVVRPARIGRGLFAARSFIPGERILTIDGRILHWRVLWKRGGQFASNCIRFGPETYLDPGDGPARYANHSCEPNAGIGKQRNKLYLFAARRIRAGAEIVFDYSTTIGDDDIWTMRCKCGRRVCRKRVVRFGLLPTARQASYLSDGLVPGFIIRTLNQST